MDKFKGAIPVLIIVNVILFAITFAVPDMDEKMFHWLALYFPQNPHFHYGSFLPTCLCMADSHTFCSTCMRFGHLVLRWS
jgi:hypothetical protein